MNEERYIWFAVMSVINFVDKILVWDTGSTDKTVEIIREIKKLYPEKIDFKEVGKVNPEEFTKTRNLMLASSFADWLMIVDADEVWWEESISNITSLIKTKGKDLDSIVSKYVNVVGDIYHFQDEAAGMYVIDGKKGHMNIRGMKMLKGMKVKKPHGTQGFFDSEGKLIQERDGKRRVHVKGEAYMHFTNMPRSITRTTDLKVPKRAFKFKKELGKEFPLDYYYPEVFFRPRPTIVPSPWLRMNRQYYLQAAIETPLKKIKRKLFYGKSGY